MSRASIGSIAVAHRLPMWLTQPVAPQETQVQDSEPPYHTAWSGPPVWPMLQAHSYQAEHRLHYVPCYPSNMAVPSLGSEHRMVTKSCLQYQEIVSDLVPTSEKVGECGGCQHWELCGETGPVTQSALTRYASPRQHNAREAKLQSCPRDKGVTFREYQAGHCRPVD